MLQLNSVKERLLFLSPVVQAGWEKESNINEFEKLGELGAGAFGIVKKMRHKKTQIVYAIKHVNKAMLKSHNMVDQIKTEIKIMYSLNHENIIKLHNHFEDNENVYLAIEFAPGGQLWDKMHRSQGKKIPEKQVAMYIKELVSALEYLHSKGIIHRDIKPENILLDNNGHIKLADFGWSNFLKPNTTRNTLCGTPDYLAPEMLTVSHTHDHMVDIWSCGVLAFELLTGRAPFAPTDFNLKGKDPEKITQENIMNVKFEYPKDFPQLAKDLVSKILRKNPKTRVGIHEIKNHPWIKLNTQGTKPHIDPSQLIAAATFGQNMAQVKQIVKLDDNTPTKTAFTEEEIMLFTRPDSLLDQGTQIKVDFDNKTWNSDQQVNEFMKQIGLSGTGNTSNITITTAATSASTTSDNTNTESNFDYVFKAITNVTPRNNNNKNQFKGFNEDQSSSSSTSTININTTQTNQQSAILKDQELAKENANLRNEIKTLTQRLVDIDGNNHRFEAECKSYEQKLKNMTNYPNTKGLYYKTNCEGIDDLRSINQNLRSQLQEQQKLIINNSYSTIEDEKQKLLDDNKLLMNIVELKLEYINLLESAVKNLFSAK